MNLDIVTSNELLFMINQLPYSLKNKIPSKIKTELNNMYSKEIYDNLIIDEPFFEQDISNESLSLFYELISTYIVDENMEEL